MLFRARLDKSPVNRSECFNFIQFFKILICFAHTLCERCGTSSNRSPLLRRWKMVSSPRTTRVMFRYYSVLSLSRLSLLQNVFESFPHFSALSLLCFVSPPSFAAAKHLQIVSLLLRRWKMVSSPCAAHVMICFCSVLSLCRLSLLQDIFKSFPRFSDDGKSCATHVMVYYPVLSLCRLSLVLSFLFSYQNYIHNEIRELFNKKL